MNTETKIKTEITGESNADPISGEPGSHPIGTVVGAAVVGSAGLAIASTVAGPVGAAAMAIGGAIAGAYAGKAAAELIDPTAEDAYWRENHPAQPYAFGKPFEDYQAAYRLGYESYHRHTGRTFDEAEPHLRAEYEESAGRNAIAWDHAVPATRAAWNRVAEQGTERSRDATGEPRLETAQEKADTPLSY
jgi:hypothetical protein